jgi:hypothetical protein
MLPCLATACAQISPMRYQAQQWRMRLYTGFQCGDSVKTGMFSGDAIIFPEKVPVAPMRPWWDD